MSQLDIFRKSWDPFRELTLTNRGFDKLFEDLYSSKWRRENSSQILSPSVDVHETKSSYELRFDLPGVPKDQIKVDLHENTLTVSGERREERKEEDQEQRSHISEVFYGAFSRSFSFPETVDADRAQAQFENGVLKLSIPKKESTPKRQIAIQ